MTATLALWYTRKADLEIKGRAPTIEVHLNLWRHIARGGDKNILDVGIRVKDHQDLGSLKLYIPIEKSNCNINDIGSLLEDKPTLGSVFNEILDIDKFDRLNGSFRVNRKGYHYLTVHPIDIDRDITVDDFAHSQNSSGIIVTFRDKFCSRLASPGEHYFRLRFNLGGPASFSSDTSSADGFIASAISVSEITELRFNEARSLPVDLLDKSERENWHVPNIDALHYFLVRDMAFDLIASHANFRKMRRLETLVWEHYLEGTLPPDVSKDMIIYHWRFGGEIASNVQDVVTLAKFRRSKNNVTLYILIVILLGALGSGVFGLTFSLFKRIDVYENIVSSLCVAALAVTLALVARFRS